jgi:hypothetical protein
MDSSDANALYGTVDSLNNWTSDINLKVCQTQNDPTAIDINLTSTLGHPGYHKTRAGLVSNCYWLPSEIKGNNAETTKMLGKNLFPAR